MVKVIKVGHGRVLPEKVHYIGRACGQFPESIFHNPFHIGKDGSRAEVIWKFAEYFYAPEQRLLRSSALCLIDCDTCLGCWCYPLPCHGDIIAGYVNWHHAELESILRLF